MNLVAQLSTFELNMVIYMSLLLLQFITTTSTTRAFYIYSMRKAPAISALSIGIGVVFCAVGGSIYTWVLLISAAILPVVQGAVWAVPALREWRKQMDQVHQMMMPK